MAVVNLEDARWLTSDSAVLWLERAAAARAENASLVQTLQRFRRELSPERAGLVVEQCELRVRAREKFPQPDRMFFTPIGLEQATDSELALYKAARFSAGELVVDACCGIGGDLLAIAERGPVIGIDRDPISAHFAEVNAHSRVLVEEIADRLPDDATAWHIDPDRRAAGHRTTKVEHYSPDETTLDRLRAAHPVAAFKLAPAADVSAAWSAAAEREWISTRGECRQQMLWFDRLARRPGERSATILSADRAPPRTIAGVPQPLPAVQPPGEYLYEPDAAVLAADLFSVLAAEHHLAPLAAAGVYLTGDLVHDPALAAFRIREVLPFDRKQLRAALRERNIGRLEIKKRGVQDTPEKIRKDLDLRGDQAAVLIVTPLAGKVAAILADRVGPI